MGNQTLPVLLAKSYYGRLVATSIVHKNALDLFETMIAPASPFERDITTVDWMSFVVADDDDSYVSNLVKDEKNIVDDLVSQIDGFLQSYQYEKYCLAAQNGDTEATNNQRVINGTKAGIILYLFSLALTD